MATPSTVNVYALNNSQREFNITFDYLSRSFIKVSMLGPVVTVLTPNVDYVFVTDRVIRTTGTWGAPGYTHIEIRRETSTTERLVEFQDASILHAVDLNLSSLQVFHVAEEARNAATESIGLDADGNLDARGRRIVNVAAPVNPGDAINWGVYSTDKQGALAARVAAEAARDAAYAYRDQAGASASQASGHANTAYNQAESSRNWAISPNTVDGVDSSSKTYAQESSRHAGNSAASAAASNTSAEQSYGHSQTASTKAAEAVASANQAYAQATTAAQWADKTDGPVAPGRYSAKYWAQVSEAGVIPDGSVTAGKLGADVNTRLNTFQVKGQNITISPTTTQSGIGSLEVWNIDGRPQASSWNENANLPALGLSVPNANFTYSIWRASNHVGGSHLASMSIVEGTVPTVSLNIRGIGWDAARWDGYGDFYQRRNIEAGGSVKAAAGTITGYLTAGTFGVAVESELAAAKAQSLVLRGTFSAAGNGYVGGNMSVTGRFLPGTVETSGIIYTQQTIRADGVISSGAGINADGYITSGGVRVLREGEGVAVNTYNMVGEFATLMFRGNHGPGSVCSRGDVLPGSYFKFGMYGSNVDDASTWRNLGGRHEGYNGSTLNPLLHQCLYQRVS